MSGSYVPPPVRELDGDRFAQLRQHLVSEAELTAAGRSGSAWRLAPRVLLAAAVVAALAVAAVAVGTLTGAGTASAAEVRAKIAASQSTPRTISGTYSVRSRDPGRPPRGEHGCSTCRPVVPLPSRFVLGADGSYASITMPPSAKRRSDIAFDAKTGVETSFLSGVLIGIRFYVRAVNVDPATPIVTPEGRLATGVQRALARRDPKVRNSTFEGRSAWKLTLDFPTSGESLRDTYGARVEIVVDRATGLVLQVTRYAFTPDRWTSIETINDLRVGRPTTAADFTVSRPADVKEVAHDYGFRRVSVAEAAEIVGYAPLLPTETLGRTLTDLAAAKATTFSFMSIYPAAPTRRAVVSARYGDGLDSITVSTYRGTAADLPALVAELSAETVHLKGALAGADAFVTNSPLDPGRVAAFHDGLLVVITAPSPNEAVAVANSLRRG